MNQLSAMFAAGDIDAGQLKTGTAEFKRQAAGIDTVLAEQVRTSPAAKLLDGGTDELENRWAALSPDMRGKIVDELMTVTVLPTPRGVKGVTRNRDTGAQVVNLDYVRIEPKL